MSKVIESFSENDNKTAFTLILKNNLKTSIYFRQRKAPDFDNATPKRISKKIRQKVWR
ncbi:hypothetical protein FACS1894174_07460 [Bacteroidia bacterium]|nr:hypothetical protein FACS1894174_07460 [Bacteroidia bacterium]